MKPNLNKAHYLPRLLAYFLCPFLMPILLFSQDIEQRNQNNLLGQYRLKNVWKNTYLSQSTDVEGAATYLDDLNEEWWSQQWIVEQGPDNSYRLRCRWKDWYLSIGDTPNGTPAIVYSLNTSWWSQQWYLEPLGNNVFRLKNRWSNRYLNAETDNDVSIYDLNLSWESQHWVLEPFGDCHSNYTLSNTTTSGTTLAIHSSNWIHAEGDIQNGAVVELKAQDYISLDPGFTAQKGSIVSIDIGGDCPAEPPTSDLANPNANAHAIQTYEFLKTYQQNPNQCLILGQNLGWSFEAYNELVQSLQQQTGHYPGLIGGQMRYTSTEIDYPALVQLYTNWQANGGLLELSMVPDNPWTGGSAWDVSVTNIAQLTTPGQPGYAAWRTQLDFYANVLKNMENAGVTILWRPLMEMNGDWFWYGYHGNSNPQPYIDLYRDMFDYFTNTWNLNNLIWVYSANVAYPGIPAVDHYYPGNDVVDITGLDVYINNLSLPLAQYQSMINLGKPFAITEFGPSHDSMDGSHDYLAYTNTILNNFPETIYAHAWHDWPGHDVAWISNQNYSAAFNLSCILNRDEMNNFKHSDDARFSRKLTESSQTPSYSIPTKSSPKKEIYLFPNPTKRQLILSLPSNEKVKNIHLFTPNGQALPLNWHQKQNTSYQLSLPPLPNGIYFLKIETEMDWWMERFIVGGN